MNQYNRKKGTYGNGDGKDASHKGGKIVGFESQSKNRGRAEKSRLKKETVNEDGHTDVASIERKLKIIIRDSVDTIKKLRSMSNEDSLPSWWTDKITLAKDYVSKSRDYIMNPTESVNESIQLPHGMELGKVFTGHGKSFVKEAVEPAGNMRKIQHIVKSKTAMKVGGTIIDMQSITYL